MKKSIDHIILVSIDTLRADCIGASPRAGDFSKKYDINFKLETGPLDKILQSGLYFNNCISAAPYTSASHASYFTGCWPLNHNVYEFFNRKLSKKTIFEYAKQSGYTTIFQTDFPVILGSYLGLTKGVDHYFIEDEITAWNTLKKNMDKKTLSFFHFGGVHYPYGFHTLKFGGNDYIRKVKQLEEKYHINFKQENQLEDVLDETFRNRLDRELLLRYKLIVEKLYNERLYDDLFLLYLEGINYFVKHRFEKFITNIKKFVDDNNALLCIFSDHGEEWDQESYGHHNSLLDPVLRVPLLFYGKGVKKGVINHLVRTIDVAPTIHSFIQSSFKKTSMNGTPLHIFRKSGKETSNKYAIAQIWPAMVDKRQLFNYQEQAIKKNKLSKPLKTFLSLEMICSKKHKLVISYAENTRMLTKKFVCHHQKSDISIEREHNKLMSILKKYNKYKKININKLKSIGLNIKEELNSLGYNV